MQQIESLGHLPVLVDSSAEALKQALRQPAQIVIADMGMPGLTPAFSAASFARPRRQGELRPAAGFAGSEPIFSKPSMPAPTTSWSSR
jgi:CheY-like chemotaxis protein